MVKKSVQRFLSNHWEWILLLLIGLVGRILFIYFQGLSNDELSAWYRTTYSTWNDFWFYGVRSGDMHPVFYQAFLWFWVRLFGDSDWIIRSSSLLFFIANIWLIYKISYDFLSKHSGLIATAIYVGSSFFIVQTTTARPYSSGLFFLLLCAYLILWAKQRNLKMSWGWAALLGFSFLGAMLSHYFAFLVVGVIGLCSFIYLPKWNWNRIMAAGVLAVLLFSFHLSVTLFQLNQGGLGWLSETHFLWWADFTRQVFQDSWWIMTLVVVILVVVKLAFGKMNTHAWFLLLCGLLASCIAYIVSISYTPILRELVFQFLFPFILLGFLGNIQFRRESSVRTFTILFAFILLTHSLMFKEILLPKNYGVFKEIALDQDRIFKDYKKKRVDEAHNFNAVDYLNFYAQKKVDETITDWADVNTIYVLNERVRKSKKEYFLYNWSNNYHVPMYLECIRQQFSSVIIARDYFNSGSFLFGKNKTERVDSISLILSNKTEVLKDSSTFFGEMKISVDSLRQKEHRYFAIESKLLDSLTEELFMVIVAERDGEMLKDGDFSVMYWAYDQKQLLAEKGRMFLAFELSPKLRDTDELKFYFWNPKGQEVTYQNVNLKAIIF